MDSFLKALIEEKEDLVKLVMETGMQDFAQYSKVLGAYHALIKVELAYIRFLNKGDEDDGASLEQGDSE